MVIDRLSFVLSPSGVLTAARAVRALRSAAIQASTAASRPSSEREGNDTGDNVKGAPVKASPVAIQIQHRLLPPIPLRPTVNTAVQIEVAELHSLLSLESRPLASIAMTRLTFEASRDQWWKRSDGDASLTYSLSSKVAKEATQEFTGTTATGWPGWSLTGGRRVSASRYLRSRVHGISVLDLTTDGQLHHEVISHVGAAEAVPSAAAGATAANVASERSDRAWKASAPAFAAATAAEMLPIVVVEVVPGQTEDRRVGEVNASVRGLRVCLLRRFIAEVAKYFGPNGLGPVFSLDFGGDVASADVSLGNDADKYDGENAFVVIGEEDAVIPDDWSILSGASGSGDGKTRREGSAGVNTSEKKFNNDTGQAITASGPNDDNIGTNSGFATKAMRVTVVLENLTVVMPRNTHSREAAAVQCQELVLEVRLQSHNISQLPVSPEE